MYCERGNIELVSERDYLVLAARACAALPSIDVAAVRPSEQDNATDTNAGITQAVIQDTNGVLYTVYSSDTAPGKKRLEARARAAQVVAHAHELAGLGFRSDRVLAFMGAQRDSLDPTILVMAHADGVSRSLELLTIDDCTSIGTTIGTIHRLQPNFIVDAKYPVHTTGQIHAQLTAWIKRLQQAGHVPTQITTSWSRILETEGLWAFNTCPVHGGFQDGDLLFSGSSITAVTNWQDMQINDPARDLAWVFTKLDDTHRNAVVSAYGRVMGSRLDDLIMLRANLWVQMEQVGDFIQALSKGDTNKIMQFKTQVDRLAHQLGITLRGKHDQAHPASTLTVNTLLKDNTENKQKPHSSSTISIDDSTDERPISGSFVLDATDKTDSKSIESVDVNEFDQTNSHPLSAQTIAYDVKISEDIEVEEENDSTDERPVSTDAQTILIPLLEREEQALRDAQAGLSDNNRTK